MKIPLLVFEQDLPVDTHSTSLPRPWIAVCAVPLPNMRVSGALYPDVLRVLEFGHPLWCEGRTKEEVVESLRKRIVEVLRFGKARNLSIEEIEV